MKEETLNLATLARLFADEDEARAFLESKRWPNGAICPRCGSTKAYALTAKKESKKPVRKGVYCCAKCRRQFTIRIGTIFEDSHIPLHKWLMAFHLMSSSKKGISSMQLHRELGITLKSAWFLSHRIREAMTEKQDGLLSGIVEVDETYVGGKPRKGSGNVKRGRGTDKTPVMALVERDGRVRSKPLERVDAKALKGAVFENVDRNSVTVHHDSRKPSESQRVDLATRTPPLIISDGCDHRGERLRNSHVMTDEFSAYQGLGIYYRSHKRVNHKQEEYVRDGVSTNTAESFFALLKRGHYGIFHSLSKHHLFRYCNEFAFRWNYRKMDDGERMLAAIRGAEGKRLMYRESVN